MTANAGQYTDFKRTPLCWIQGASTCLDISQKIKTVSGRLNPHLLAQETLVSLRHHDVVQYSILGLSLVHSILKLSA